MSINLKNRQSKSNAMSKKSRNNEKGRRKRILFSSVYATTVTVFFALICPAIVVASVMAYARFVRSSSVDIEWRVFGMLGDPLAVLACGVVWVFVFTWKLHG